MSTYTVETAASKAATLAAFATALHFPDWYGHNLDALADCLGDLSWLPPGPVLIEWDDRPLRAADPAAHQAIREILADAESTSRGSERPVAAHYSA